jgi:hypothetical protein
MGPMSDETPQSADAVRPGKVLVAMSGGVDSSVAAAHRQAGMLLDQRRRRRPARRRPARHPVLRLQLQARLRADHRLLRGRVQRRPHAQPVRALQRLAQVRQAPRLRRQIGADSSPRALRPHRHATPPGTALLRRGVDHARTSPTSSSACPRDRWTQMLLPIGEMHQARVRELAERASACRCSTSPTARRSASSRQRLRGPRRASRRPDLAAT